MAAPPHMAVVQMKAVVALLPVGKVAEAVVLTAEAA
jgi:hypothetical protein